MNQYKNVDNLVFRGEPRIFGDNDELCIYIPNANGTLKLYDVFITNININTLWQEQSTLLCGKTGARMITGREMELGLSCKDIAFINQPELSMTQNRFRQATILELLQLVNEKIKDR